jgi:hypothetical protein
MDRTNHYEAAFEDYVRGRRLGYVAVDEARRAVLGDGRVKNLDFIVYGEGDARLLVDVKGRRFPSGTPERPRRVWECWSTRDDVDGLRRWAGLFGPGFLGVLVFAYELAETVEVAADTADLWTFRNRRYLFRAVAVNDYRAQMRIRSPRWGTVSLPGAVFRDLVRPLQCFLCPAPAIAGECLS